ncbi:MAG: lysophospholipid acyltransferase family protein [Desulfatiglandales bacterium]
MIHVLIKALFLMMTFIPLPLGRFLGKLLGTALSLVPTSRTAVVLENIRKSFPGTPYAEDPDRLMRKVFLHYGQMLFEVPHILRMTHENLERYVVFQDIENLEQALEKGKGVFGLTAHFGNWEVTSAAMSLRFRNLAIVVRPIDFPPFDRFMEELRSRFGMEIIPKRRAMRRLLGALKERKVIGILLDQNVAWYEGVFVNFLGRRACTNKGLALLALKTGAPVVPVFSVRQKDGRFRIICEPEIQLVRTGDKTMDIEENTARFTAVIEKYVREYPDYWFWFHRRWKTLPYCKLPEAFVSSDKKH